MNDPVSNERIEVRRRMLEWADAAIDTREDVLWCARQVYRLWRRYLFLVQGNWDWPESDDDFKFLLYVESELDPYPFGDERAMWAPDALNDLESELNSMRSDWGAKIVAVCVRIRSEFGSDGTDGEQT
jgi:hypothetical protein